MKRINKKKQNIQKKLGSERLEPKIPKERPDMQSCSIPFILRKMQIKINIKNTITG